MRQQPGRGNPPHQTRSASISASSSRQGSANPVNSNGFNGTVTSATTAIAVDRGSDVLPYQAPGDLAAGLDWRRIDLHIHTPGSIDYQEPKTSLLDILKQAEARELDLIALTDHNSVRGYADMWREIEDLELLEYLGRIQPAEIERLAEYRRLLTRVLVLPGFEFTATFGFHILAIFPERTSVRMMEHLLLALGVPEDRFGSGEVGATSDVLSAYKLLADHGALVIGAHVNSTHGVAMQGLRFGGQTKIAYTQDEHLHALEVTDLALGIAHRRSTARFFSGIKSEYPRRMHCIQGSDAHRVLRDPSRDTSLGIGDRATEVLLPEVSFAALKKLFASDAFDYSRPYALAPDDPVIAARLEGPGESLAFHESLATKRTGMSHVLRDIVAFANRNGGDIFVGASAAEKRPVHGVEDAEAGAAALAADIEEQITPRITCEIEQVTSGDKDVLIVRVLPGPDKPYALATGAIVVRDGAETRVATRDEIVAMVRGASMSPVPALAPSTTAPTITKAPAPAVLAELVETPIEVPVDPRREGERANGNANPTRATASRTTVVDSEVIDENDPRDGFEIYEEDAGPDPVAPRTGMEVVGKRSRDGVDYYTLRDLRDHRLIYNVTRETDRRLWRAAITQHEDQVVDESKVRWSGNLGISRSFRQRGGEKRYHLMYRGVDGMRVFYGVSEPGMTGAWKTLLPPATPAKTPVR